MSTGGDQTAVMTSGSHSATQKAALIRLLSIRVRLQSVMIKVTQTEQLS